MKLKRSFAALACGALLAACEKPHQEVLPEDDGPQEAAVPVPDMEDEVPGMEDATIPPGHVAKSLEEWIPEFHRVDAVLYDYTADESASLVTSGKLHQGVVKTFTKMLSKTEVERLESLVTGSRNGNWGALCYQPHHGFVFYDEAGKILGHLEICLMCQNYKYAPNSKEEGEGPLSDNWDLQGMETLLKEKGFPVFDHPKKWEVFFADQK